VTENPPFLSTTGSSASFLHIDPAIGTQIESGASTVAGVADDYDGDARNPSTPDIGADEGAFTPAFLTINASAGAGGSISPSGAVSVNCGANQSFSISADPCYSIADVLVDGSSVGAVASYTFTNVMAGHTIAASFSLNTYTIAASAGAGGSISPSGNVSVNCGSNQSFSIAADPCYSIAEVLVDGSSVGAVSSYTFTNVQAG